MKTKLISTSIIVLLALSNATILFNINGKASEPSWPSESSWNQSNLVADANESGWSDDYRDIKYSYYYIDEDYIYFRLECYLSKMPSQDNLARAEKLVSEIDLVEKGEELAAILHKEFPDSIEDLLANFNATIPLSEEGRKRINELLADTDMKDVKKITRGFEVYLDMNSIKYDEVQLLLRVNAYVTGAGAGQRAYERALGARKPL